MKFQSVFIAVLVSSVWIVGATLLNSKRPASDLAHPNASLIRATGKCAECHRLETGAVVHQFEMSAHAEMGVTCLDCHQPSEGQAGVDHRGFMITADLTAKNCAACHATEYEQFLRSRHAAPAWAAVEGSDDFTEEQIKKAEQYHPGAVRRAANKLAQLEGAGVLTLGCNACHSIGKPNLDGSIGSCTECHSRHSTSIALAREPQTCGQCHMGPDHSQLEIYTESKHGILFNAQRDTMNLAADPKSLSISDMSVPTCATCHMSGLEGLNVTHDTTERLSYWLFASTSEKRPTYMQGQIAMQEVCLKCHASTQVDTFYAEAEEVVRSTNEKIAVVDALMAEAREEGLLTPEPFDEEIEFVEFDYWHYFGRTAKHGAFMGGADFVQWHGNYELLAKRIEIEKMVKELREASHE